MAPRMEGTWRYAGGRRTGTWAMVEGIVMVVLGLIAVFARYPTVAAATLGIALYLVVKGILEVVAAFRAQGEGAPGGDLAFGIVAILAAVLLFARDILGGIGVGVIVAGYLLVEGVARLVIGYMGRGPGTGWGWQAAVGAVDLVLGVYVLAAPALTLTTLAVLVGLDILATGAAMIVVGAVRRSHRTHGGLTPV